MSDTTDGTPREGDGTPREGQDMPREGQDRDLPGETGPGFPGFDEIAPPKPAPAAAGYRVLARKYRPSHFGDLIGQDAMVRTLTNAFSTGRIPQAWMLTGVRGVGKTTTARILARGLNFERPDGSGGPTTDLSEMGRHCQAIIEGRHIDVMEIDAASNNSVENVRQINDAVHYAPASARYKVYIVDEVHMLSQGAFNAFLKTLEEPPPHAKFIFATTEIRKVPVTVLSRCQRFDLRRVDAGLLVSHLAGICAKEGVEAEPGALTALARAAEGSVRDALSLLDQAIAHSSGLITVETVLTMLGLADRARVIDLFEAIMRGDLVAALAELKAQYDTGADPQAVIAALAEFTHLVTRLKITPEAARDPALSEAERTRGGDFASRLSLRVLARTWQMLARGHAEMRDAPRPLAAAEMLLVRLAHAADLPTPDEALRLLNDGAGVVGGGAMRASAQPGGGATGTARAPETKSFAGGLSDGPQPGAGLMQAQGGGMTASAIPAQAQAAPRLQPVIAIGSFAELVQLAGQKRDLQTKAALERDIRLVAFEDGRMRFALAPGASPALAGELGRKLREWTGRNWIIDLVQAEGQATLREQAAEARQRRESDAMAHPLVQAVLGQFRGARIVDVRDRSDDSAPGTALPPPPVEADEDGPPAWMDDVLFEDDF